jgi:hypothetical protein
MTNNETEAPENYIPTDLDTLQEEFEKYQKPTTMQNEPKSSTAANSVRKNQEEGREFGVAILGTTWNMTYQDS